MIENDKTSVPSVALGTLGKLLHQDEGRDAIHLATYSIVAGEDLNRGEDVEIDNNGLAVRVDSGLGIVDPFLEQDVVYKGQIFWMLIRPRVITGLRHVWTHPNIADENSTEVAKQDETNRLDRVKESEKWIREFCENSGNPSYDDVIERALECEGDDDDYLHFSGQDAHGDIPDEFWTHLEVVTGVKIQNPPDHFSCGC